jgi:hypothetical protein
MQWWPELEQSSRAGRKEGLVRGVELLCNALNLDALVKLHDFNA